MTEQRKERLSDMPRRMREAADLFGRNDSGNLRTFADEIEAALSLEPETKEQSQCKYCIGNKYPVSPNDMMPCPHHVQWNTRPGDNNALSPSYEQYTTMKQNPPICDKCGEPYVSIPRMGIGHLCGVHGEPKIRS